MLCNCPVIAFIPTRDAAKARIFYEDVLGLSFVNDDAFAIVMDANGTMIRIVRVGEFTPMPFTMLGFQVENIDQAVAELTSKGLVFARYAYFEQSGEGIWTAPNGAKVAWFLDPDGNTLSISQH